jgi:LemA protein
MEFTLITLGVVALGLVIIVGTIVGIYNSIIAGKNRVKRAWADVIAYEVQKQKVIPALERGMKEYKEFESDTFKKIAELRTATARLSSDSIDPQLLEKAQAATQSLFTGLRATFEAYPTLKASELYTKWMRSLEEMQQNITAAITIFNQSVESFNDSIQQFPGSLVNSLLNKEPTVNTFTDTAAQAELEYKPNL